MAFRVGQKVVCIKGPSHLHFCAEGPQLGDVVTIRWIGWCPLYNLQALRFVEFVGAESSIPGEELAYEAGRFRPAVTTDISIFKAMLSPTKEPTHA